MPDLDARLGAILEAAEIELDAEGFPELVVNATGERSAVIETEDGSVRVILPTGIDDVILWEDADGTRSTVTFTGDIPTALVGRVVADLVIRGG